MKAFLLTVLILALCAAFGAFLYWYRKPIAYGETKTYTVGDGKTLRVGILSDTQLAPTALERHDKMYRAFEENLRRTLTQMQAQNVQMLIFDGDICNRVTFQKTGWKIYFGMIREIWPDESSRPITLSIMGNHDMWMRYDFKTNAVKQKLYRSVSGENPYIHKIVNGYHFIGASTSIGQQVTFDEKALAWLKAELEKAEKDTPAGKPVFVITHHPPEHTMYGSEDWAAPDLDAILSPYDNVVSISGHTHYALTDERSLMQRDYTAFATQSVAYMELEVGRFDAFKGENTTCPPNSRTYPAALFMEIGTQEIQIRRWNVARNEEEAAQNRWVLTYPLCKANFAYTFDGRKEKFGKPVFENTNLTYAERVASPYSGREKTTLQGIRFTAAKGGDMIHHYDVQLSDAAGRTSTYSYFSDFYLGRRYMQDTVEIALDKKLKRGKYTVSVTAVNSFGTKSEPIYGEITLQ